MRTSFALCKRPQPLVSSPVSPITTASFNGWRRKEKVVVVMGATGTGKSRLSIELATHFASEIVNSDKMQVYNGLDIATNKITIDERCSIPHHLLGVVDPDEEFSSLDFRHHALLAIESILGRKHHPIIVGGSNSFIEALVNIKEPKFRSKYEYCFLWVDVSLPVLHSFVSNRVDRMVEMGLVEEIRRMFKPDVDYNRGIRRAIGLLEMDQYFRVEAIVDEETRARLLEEAIQEIKINTCKLACQQLQNIHRLQSQLGWNMHRINATEVFLLTSDREAKEAWHNLVVGPSTAIMRQFLSSTSTSITNPTNLAALTTTGYMGAPVSVATR